VGLAAAQWGEVLPPQAYAKAHLPGAFNIPLQKLNHHTITALQRDRAVIVYGYDLQET